MAQALCNISVSGFNFLDTGTVYSVSNERYGNCGFVAAFTVGAPSSCTISGPIEIAKNVPNHVRLIRQF